MIKVGSLRYGVIFKKAFSDPEIFTGFVRDVLNVNLSIDNVETEKSFTPCIGSVDVRFDLFAQDTKNRVIVDIQHIRYPDHYHRFLHYHCVALIEMISNSKNYRPSTSVYTIVVLTSSDKYKEDILVIDFDPHTLKGKPIHEIPHKIFLLMPKYITPETPEPFREWMMAIDDSLDEEVDETKYHTHEIQKAINLIKKDIITPKEYAIMKEEYSYGLVLDEKYLKGREKGHEEGLEKGQALILCNQMSKRFKLDKDVVKQKLNELENNDLSELGDMILDYETPEPIFSWIDKRIESHKTHKKSGEEK